MAWHPNTAAQLAGLSLLLLGWILSCVTTYVPLWKRRNLDLNEIETWNAGLWQVCVVWDGDVMECRSHDSFLALPLATQVSRVIMVASNALGLLAAVLSVWGSDWMKTGGRKPGLLVGGGVVSCLSGAATLVPVSWTAYNIVQDFWDETVPDIVPRWDLGDALFLGWFAGTFLISGGFFLLCSGCFLMNKIPPRPLSVHQKLRAQMSPNRYQNSSPKNEYLVI
ncbi:putative claudin-25 [Anolis carolinensis]|uniref:Claudin n=1 Tax=Anolis carolinensis TaxID=28377 RepID=H9GQ42_ANOCA|nr:PREDICTED: putative claudin-25 [Anolis carolinensis]|eukprot:XP_003226223.1 PREDICTED: putative claudin-25 [Anolis carolinensis]